MVISVILLKLDTESLIIIKLLLNLVP